MPMDSDGNRGIYAVIALTVTNIVGNILVVHSFDGTMFGFGVATSAGYVAAFIVFLAHFFRKNRILRFDYSELLSKTMYLKDIFINGTPYGTEKVASAAYGIMMNYMLVSMTNETYIALYSIFGQIMNLLYPSYSGPANTVLSLTGVFFGEEDRKALDTLQRTSIFTGGRIVLALSVIVLLFPGLFIRMFLDTANTELITLGPEAVRVLALTLPLYLIQNLFGRYLIGTKHIRAANVYGILMQCGVVVPTVFVMIRCIGGRGL